MVLHPPNDITLCDPGKTILPNHKNTGNKSYVYRAWVAQWLQYKQMNFDENKSTDDIHID